MLIVLVRPLPLLPLQKPNRILCFLLLFLDLQIHSTQSPAAQHTLTSYIILWACVGAELFFALESGIVNTHFWVIRQFYQPQWGIGVDINRPLAVILSPFPVLLLVMKDLLHVGAALKWLQEAALSWAVHCTLPVALDLRKTIHVRRHLACWPALPAFLSYHEC